MPNFQCGECGHVIRKGEKFCKNCGAELLRNNEKTKEKTQKESSKEETEVFQCGECRYTVKEGAKICKNCGAELVRKNERTNNRPKKISFTEEEQNFQCGTCGYTIKIGAKSCPHCKSTLNWSCIKEQKNKIKTNKQGIIYEKSTWKTYTLRTLLLLWYIILSYGLARLLGQHSNGGEDAIRGIFFGLCIFEIFSFIKAIKNIKADMYETKKDENSKLFYKKQILGRFIFGSILFIILLSMFISDLQETEILFHYTGRTFLGIFLSVILIGGIDFMYNYFFFWDKCTDLRSTRPSMLAMVFITFCSIESTKNGGININGIFFALAIFILIKILTRIGYLVYEKIKSN